MLALCVEDKECVLQQVKPPVLIPHSVRISVKAIGVNRADILQRKGFYPAPAGVRNDILGLECSGVVVEVSTDLSIDVQNAWMGKAVMALVPGAAYAREVVVDIGSVMRIPTGLSFVQAAGIPEVFLTAFDALFMQAGLKQGHKVLIHAIGSGVGDAARQLCIAMGYKVFGTTRSKSKWQRLTSETCPVYLIEDGVFPVDLPKVDVILDFVGAAYLSQNLQWLQKGGHLQIIGLLGGVRETLNLGTILTKQLTIRGTTLRARSDHQKQELVASFEVSCRDLLTTSELSPTIDSVYDWRDVEQAHQYMQDNQNVGKIILQVAS